MCRHSSYFHFCRYAITLWYFNKEERARAKARHELNKKSALHPVNNPQMPSSESETSTNAAAHTVRRPTAASTYSVPEIPPFRPKTSSASNGTSAPKQSTVANPNSLKPSTNGAPSTVSIPPKERSTSIGLTIGTSSSTLSIPRSNPDAIVTTCIPL